MASWQEFIANQQQQAYYQELQQRITLDRAASTVYPPAQDVLRAFALTPLERVKVVIIGQDPYHQPGQANGLAFSVARGMKVPPSLQNMYKAICHDYPQAKLPTHGDLSCWAEQGVLLLNTSLTVREAQAGSHAKLGWQQFTQAALSYLAEQRACVYLLWGKHAQDMALPIIRSSRFSEQAKVLCAVHPSPLSAHRGFLTCGHFRACNEWLLERGEQPIKWLSEAEKEIKVHSQYTLL